MNPLVTPMAKDDASGTFERSNNVKCDESSSHWTYLKTLIQVEESSYPCPVNYIDSTNAPPGNDDGNDDSRLPRNNRGITENLRCRIVEWLFSLVDHFGIDRECAMIAINYTDRAVARHFESQLRNDNPSSESPRMAPLDFQLIAVASAFLAVKTHGVSTRGDIENQASKRHSRISLKNFVHMGRDRFSEEDVCASELQILDDLEWKLNPPTAMRFLTSIVGLFPVWTPSERDMRIFLHSRNAAFELSRYLIELSACLSSFAFTFPPSLIAYSAVLCALESLKDHIDLPYQVRAALLNSLSQLPGFSPQNPKVRQLQQMLRDLCPGIFQGQFPEEFKCYLSRIVEADQQTASSAAASASPHMKKNSDKECPKDSNQESDEINSSKASPVTVIMINGQQLGDVSTPDSKKRKMPFE